VFARDFYWQNWGGAGPSPVEQMRERLLAEAHRDAHKATAGPSERADWTSSGIDGLMLDPDEEPDPKEWR
jgi:hypothetical protein